MMAIRDLLIMLDELQEKRVLAVDYQEMQQVIEFLWHHNASFKVTSIDEEKDFCMIHLI
jgi:hypothetical protein